VYEEGRRAELQDSTTFTYNVNEFSFLFSFFSSQVKIHDITD